MTDRSTLQAATGSHVVYHYLRLRAERRLPDSYQYDNTWDVEDTSTTIVGIPLEMDGDYMTGVLLDIAESGKTGRTYIAVAMRYGPKIDSDGDFVSWDHEWAFFDPTSAAHSMKEHWAVDFILNCWEA